jgi:pimeloyl-ACP methyl ester carboxylesterase
LVDKPKETLPEGIASLVLQVNGRRMHYLQAGSGLPVVLLHGGASDSRDWYKTMAGLSGRFTFYAPDLPGYGQNERDDAGYYLDDFISSIEEFIIALGLDNPAIAGHSFGGRVGAGVALRDRVRVRRLVLVDTAGLGKVSSLGSWLMTVFWALRRLLRKPQPYPRFLTREGEDGSWLFADELSALKAPLLLVWKRRDPYFPVSLARRAANLVPGVRLEVLPGFGHAPNKQNSEVFNRLLLDFLDGN